MINNLSVIALDHNIYLNIYTYIYTDKMYADKTVSIIPMQVIYTTSPTNWDKRFTPRSVNDHLIWVTDDQQASHGKG